MGPFSAKRNDLRASNRVQVNSLSSHRELSGCFGLVDAVTVDLRQSRGIMESNASYFSRRAREELFAAIRADHHKGRRAHLDLAARYDDLVRSIEVQEPRSEPNPELGLQVEVEHH